MDRSNPPYEPHRFSQHCQENTEVTEDGFKASYRLHLHLGILTTSRSLKKGDKLRFLVSGSGHVHVGLMVNKPTASEIQTCYKVRFGIKDYALLFRLKSTAAEVIFQCTGSKEVMFEEVENGNSRVKRCRGAIWPVIDIHFGNVSVKLIDFGDMKRMNPPKSITFDKTHGANVHLLAGCCEARLHEDNPRALVFTNRPLKLGEIIQLDVQPADHARWHWLGIYVTTIQPEDFSRQKLGEFKLLSPCEKVKCMKVKNHVGSIVVKLTETKQFIVDRHGKYHQVDLRHMDGHKQIYLCLKLFRVEVAIQSQSGYFSQGQASEQYLTVIPGPVSKPSPPVHLVLPTRSLPTGIWEFPNVAPTEPDEETVLKQLVTPGSSALVTLDGVDHALTRPQIAVRPLTEDYSDVYLTPADRQLYPLSSGHMNAQRTTRNELPVGNLSSNFSCGFTGQISTACKMPLGNTRLTVQPSSSNPADLQSSHKYAEILLGETRQSGAHGRVDKTSQGPPQTTARIDLLPETDGYMDMDHGSDQRNLYKDKAGREEAREPDNRDQKLSQQFSEGPSRVYFSDLYTKLRSHYGDLQAMVATKVASSLFRDHVITHEELQRVKEGLTPSGRSAILLDLLLSRPDTEDAFRKALVDTGQASFLQVLDLPRSQKPV